MLEVATNIFVGTVEDLSNWPHRWVAACKEPCHREALGYTTQGAPKGHKEYLFAYRKNGLILNLVDGNDPKWIDRSMIDEAISFITDTEPTLIVCNQGRSRSPSIALMWLNKNKGVTLEDFLKVYPAYSPARGIGEFTKVYIGEAP